MDWADSQLDSDASEDDANRVLSVTELTMLVKGTLESAFSSVWVEGEISNMARPQSGHVYLTLKDEGAQIRGVLWRNAASRLKFDLEDGQKVVCRGDIDVYPPRGSYQLVIRSVEPQGVGALQLAFRQMQERLAAEGLFEPRHKKPLPKFPRRIAFVTSPTGAAIRDFLEVIHRRWRGVDVLIIPARVQGEGAADEIAVGIETANRLAEPPDLLVVGRGGGSMEDLWCFNEEDVVRAIFASRVPVISAVGHDIDVTLSDLVADLRAATPSEAAELAAPSGEDLKTALQGIGGRLAAALRRRAEIAKSDYDALAQHRVFRRPFQNIQDLALRLDELALRASRSVDRRLTRAGEQIESAAARLESLSPLAVLARGFSITQQSDGKVVRDVSELGEGDMLITRLAGGSFVSRVEKIEQE